MSARSSRPTGSFPPSCVAIPVKDEAERIGLCLQALSDQDGPAPNHVVLLVNNTSDQTEAVVERLRPALRFPVTCALRMFPPERANAGVARSEAMRLAAGIVGADGVLLATDADGRVRPDWLSATMEALSRGVDVVCGRAEIDPVEALLIPSHLHEDDAREVAFGALIDRIHALADPDPLDPWPRHTEHSGASIAVTVSAWRAAGGVPALPNGEDRAFLRALRQVDRPIRHDPAVRVVVSGRIAGRASGGMAETIARRILRQDALLDDSLEPAADALRRAQARAGFRRLRETGAVPDRVAAYASSLGLPAAFVAAQVTLPFMGRGWDAVEAASPRLARRGVQRAFLDRHREEALRIVAGLLREREAGRESAAEACAGPVSMSGRVEPVPSRAGGVEPSA